MKTWGLTFSFVVWLGATSVSIIMLGGQTSQEFDPSLRLSQALMNLSFEKQLKETVSIENSAAIYHISDTGCACTFASNIHKNSLNKWADTMGIKQVEVSLADNAALADMVPSTPAIMVLGMQGQLIYFGPYSQGAGCFASEGVVDKVIKPYFDGQVLSTQQATIRSEAVGCYCENKRRLSI